MHDDDLARTIPVRVRVFLGRSPVRRPARMPDPVISVQRIEANAFFEVSQFPFRAAEFELLRVIDDGDARRIVPRYSNLRSPSIMSGTTCLFPTYPTIPHIFNNFISLTSQIILTFGRSSLKCS
jgi:hypothetical protein